MELIPVKYCVTIEIRNSKLNLVIVKPPRLLSNLGGSLQIPTFFILGKHDHDVGYKEQFALESNFKKSNLVVLENAGHNLPIDQGNIFSACVKTFFS